MSSKKRDYRDQIFLIDSELSKIQDADILLERILMEARRVLNAEAGTIYVREGDQLLFKYSQNATLEKRLPPGHKLPMSNARIPIDDSRAAGYAAKNRVAVRIDDAYAIPADKPYKFNPSFDKQNGWKTKLHPRAAPHHLDRATSSASSRSSTPSTRPARSIPFTAQDEKIMSGISPPARPTPSSAPS